MPVTRCKGLYGCGGGIQTTPSLNSTPHGGLGLEVSVLGVSSRAVTWCKGLYGCSGDIPTTPSLNSTLHREGVGFRGFGAGGEQQGCLPGARDCMGVVGTLRLLPASSSPPGR